MAGCSDFATLPLLLVDGKPERSHRRLCVSDVVFVQAVSVSSTVEIPPRLQFQEQGLYGVHYGRAGGLTSCLGRSPDDGIAADRRNRRARCGLRLSNNWVYRVLPPWLGPMRSLRAGIGRSAGSSRCGPASGQRLWPPMPAAHLGQFSGRQLVFHLVLYFVGSVAHARGRCTYNGSGRSPRSTWKWRAPARARCCGTGHPHAGSCSSCCRRWWGWSWSLQFNWFSGSSSASCRSPLAALYPLPSAFTDWPQFFLGLAFLLGRLDGLGGDLRQPLLSRRSSLRSPRWSGRSVTARSTRIRIRKTMS